MKIISLYTDEKLLIKKASAGNPQAQKFMYDKHAPKMLGICRQYIKDLQFAEDTMIKGFVKVFQNLDSFQHKGSFEGWIRKIMVRESISYLRKRQFVVYDDEVYEQKDQEQDSDTSLLDVEYVQQLIDKLPEGYRMVFLLNAIEGYKHHEISEMLGISVGTSKSQLFKARKMLQEVLTLKGIPSRTKSGD
ncbi:RNA polymerase sigma factor [Flagellimonas sp. HMM57]|uniref:RNA polymerase sigma factor n=1 Tax=unclassified Flagellimonas TaxID=2644544 RepID=UPI0013D59ADB|nr:MULTISPECIES: RNA polymerase sigma factor [unclassified Flagellimonas]UII77944.1 RNA polymerase sigma factor [Flagellimonas sp. HMM57]